MRGVRFIRNSIHHDWSDALELAEGRAYPEEATRSCTSSGAGEQRTSYPSRISRTSTVRRFYRDMVEGKLVRDTLGVTGRVFLFLRQVLEPSSLGTASAPTVDMLITSDGPSDPYVRGRLSTPLAPLLVRVGLLLALLDRFPVVALGLAGVPVITSSPRTATQRLLVRAWRNVPTPSAPSEGSPRSACGPVRGIRDADHALRPPVGVVVVNISSPVLTAQKLVEAQETDDRPSCVTRVATHDSAALGFWELSTSPSLSTARHRTEEGHAASLIYGSVLPRI